MSRNRSQALGLCHLTPAPAFDEPGESSHSHGVELLLSLIRETLVAYPDQPVRIASVGWPEGREIAVALERWPEIGPRLEVAVLGSVATADRVARRSLARLAEGAGATVRFLPVERFLAAGAGQLSLSIGARHLIYCNGQSLPPGESLVSLMPHLHGRLAPGGLLVLLDAAANEGTGVDLLAWARTVPGNSVEMRQVAFGPLAYLAIRR